MTTTMRRYGPPGTINLSGYSPAELLWLWGRVGGALLATPWRMLGLWHERARQREELASLDDHMLSDVGLTREQVRREIVKPFWEG